MAEEDALDALRAELDALDDTLLELAAQRMGVVERIGALKAGAERPLFDRERERGVLDRARRKAASLGLPEQVGEDLVHGLVEASHQLQGARMAYARAATTRRVLVVGGRGKMGSLFARAFSERGHEVDILEKDDGCDRPAAARAADVVIVSVDMDAAEAVTQALAPHIRPDALLCDLNSLKERVCGVYEGMLHGEGLGLHPMFGGTVRSLHRQKVVVCRVRSGPLTDWMCAELGALGLELVEVDPSTHDRMMAVVQVLLHFITVVMGNAFRRTGVPVRESLRFTSPIYRLELSVVARLFAQDPDLYASIILDNPHSAEMRAHFLEAAREVQAAVEAGDREEFRRVFREVDAYFAGFSEEAMRMSDALIDFLVARA
ncbi:MAG: bifunctional chorismate mutase/prephenate dehydrogenase [Deltaproteobacteria bacterium]|nr:bifunctional chorismate mutase/prephenate dehydrogenase [Deltaproteobacteria bacterium]